MTLSNSPLFPLSISPALGAIVNSVNFRGPLCSTHVLVVKSGDAGSARKVDKRPAERDTATLW